MLCWLDEGVGRPENAAAHSTPSARGQPWRSALVRPSLGEFAEWLGLVGGGRVWLGGEVVGLVEVG